jgi:hypothetical protein
VFGFFYPTADKTAYALCWTKDMMVPDERMGEFFLSNDIYHV